MKTIELTEAEADMVLALVQAARWRAEKQAETSKNDRLRRLAMNEKATAKSIVEKLMGKPDGAAADMERESGAC